MTRHTIIEDHPQNRLPYTHPPITISRIHTLQLGINSLSLFQAVADSDRVPAPLVQRLRPRLYRRDEIRQRRLLRLSGRLR